MKTFMYAHAPVLPLKDVVITNDQKVRYYESLLYKIAYGFGFTNTVVQELVDDTTAYAIQFFGTCGDDVPIRIRLSKLIVQKCVRKVSESMFQQSGPWHKEMPLSFHTVYMLNKEIGFNENEIAVILNTTPFIIRTIWNKALLFINRHA